MFWIELNQGNITRKQCGSKQVCVKSDLRMSYRDPESLLFEAIFGGNTCKVQQLINSGIDKNTVLHSPIRWEGATVLGTAAFEGHIDIVKYLIQVGTSINFTDPCLSRNALHWACMGNQYQIAKYLLDHGANVNCCDKDGVTPILRATLNKNCDLTKLLIERGADLNVKDRLKSSPLHYASVHGDSELIQMVIKAGCVQNNEAILGKGTPFANIVHHKDFKSCCLLLEAGYDMTNDTWMIYWEEYMGITRNSHTMGLIMEELKDPPSLMSKCRMVVRLQIGGISLKDKVQSLNLPQRIKRYLMFEEE